MKLGAYVGGRAGALTLALTGVMFASASWAAAASGVASVEQAAGSSSRNATLPVRSSLRYDWDYPLIDYSGEAEHNAIARLQAKLDRGEVKLVYREPRGYLDSLLEVLGIDVSSQTLVHSKTSLQKDDIDHVKPRAIYFNDDTYVAWVQGSPLLEFMAMDREKGPVFYSMINVQARPLHFEREMQRCLTCHDTYSMSGGGVPRFLFVSTLVATNGEFLVPNLARDTTDATPIAERWGGWYVTGLHGDQVHLGNIVADSARNFPGVEQARRGNLKTLDGLVDMRPYPTNTSDIVALLVFEHQAYFHNLITRLNYKARTVVGRELGEKGAAHASWDEMSPRTQRALKAMLEPVVQAMLFKDAAPLTSKITGTAGFERWFEAQGPRDSRGRSLRKLNLTTRVFEYPVTFLVYTEGFDGLPDYARTYIFKRLAEVLSGRDTSREYAYLDPAARTAALEILAETKPEFAAVLSN
jgi:hypothetical protein